MMSMAEKRNTSVQRKEAPPERQWVELHPTPERKWRELSSTDLTKLGDEPPAERQWASLSSKDLSKRVELTPVPPDNPSKSDTIDHQRRSEASKMDTSRHYSPHPPGYNKRKRDIVKLVLVVVAAGLLRGDPVMATVLSIVAMICLKEGTFWSTRNIKWMGLCVISFGMSLAAWSLERESAEANEEKTYTLNSKLYVSSKTIQLFWGTILSLFLISAYVHGHNSFLEFEFLNEAKQTKLPTGPRKDPPPKTYLLY